MGRWSVQRGDRRRLALLLLLLPLATCLPPVEAAEIVFFLGQKLIDADAHSGEIWAYSPTALLHISNSGLRTFPVPSPYLATAILADSDGVLVGTNLGLLRVSRPGQFSPSEPEIEFGSITSLVSYREERWVGTRAGLFRLSGGGYPPLPLLEKHAIEGLKTIDGSLWIASDRNLYLWRGGEKPVAVLPRPRHVLQMDRHGEHLLMQLSMKLPSNVRGPDAVEIVSIAADCLEKLPAAGGVAEHCINSQAGTQIENQVITTSGSAGQFYWIATERGLYTTSGSLDDLAEWNLEECPGVPNTLAGSDGKKIWLGTSQAICSGPPFASENTGLFVNGITRADDRLLFFADQGLFLWDPELELQTWLDSAGIAFLSHPWLQRFNNTRLLLGRSVRLEASFVDGQGKLAYGGHLNRRLEQIIDHDHTSFQKKLDKEEYTSLGTALRDLPEGPQTVHLALRLRSKQAPLQESSARLRVLSFPTFWKLVLVSMPLLGMFLIFVSPWIRWAGGLIMNPATRRLLYLGLGDATAAVSPLRRRLLRRQERTLRIAWSEREPPPGPLLTLRVHQLLHRHRIIAVYALLDEDVDQLLHIVAGARRGFWASLSASWRWWEDRPPGTWKRKRLASLWRRWNHRRRLVGSFRRCTPLRLQVGRYTGSVAALERGLKASLRNEGGISDAKLAELLLQSGEFLYVLELPKGFDSRADKESQAVAELIESRSRLSYFLLILRDLPTRPRPIGFPAWTFQNGRLVPFR